MTREFTTGLLTLMKTMMVTTAPTKVMESWMHSQPMEHNGLTLTTMDMETILLLPFNPMLALQCGATVLKIAMAASMQMVTDGLISTTGLLLIQSNGSTLTTTDMATITCTTLLQTNFILINEVMHSLTMPLNGTTLMATVTETTTKMLHGMLTEHLNGLV
jgi:hypothetical protein